MSKFCTKHMPERTTEELTTYRNEQLQKFKTTGNKFHQTKAQNAHAIIMQRAQQAKGSPVPGWSK